MPHSHSSGGRVLSTCGIIARLRGDPGGHMEGKHRCGVQAGDPRGCEDAADAPEEGGRVCFLFLTLEIWLPSPLAL